MRPKPSQHTPLEVYDCAREPLLIAMKVNKPRHVLKGNAPGTPVFWENKGPVSLGETLYWCLREHRVDTLLVTSSSFIDRKGKASFDSAIDGAAKAILGKYLIKRFNATGWPGTELTKHSGRVYVAHFDRTLLKRLVKTEGELFNWVHWPNGLPENICVFKSGSRYPSLISVTHEKDAFILDDRDLSPPAFERSNLPGDQWYVWSGPYFCRTSQVKHHAHK